MLFELASCMRVAGLGVSIEELEDIVWLAERLPQPQAATDEKLPPVDVDAAVGKDETTDGGAAPPPPAGETMLNRGEKAAKKKGGETTSFHSGAMSGTVTASTLRVPGVASSEHPEDLRRALQPFARRVPSRWRSLLDEDETASRAADTGVWCPVYRPVRERWFDLSVVVESSSSMSLWSETLQEFMRLLRNQGGFRSITEYRLDDAQGREVVTADGRRRLSLAHLVSGERPHLMLLVSDATSPRWRSGAAHAFLDAVGQAAAVSVLQPLPRRSWRNTAVGEPEISLFSERAGASNARMKALLPWWLDEAEAGQCLRVPVIGLDAGTIRQWARTMTARGGAAVPGVLMVKPRMQSAGPVAEMTPAARVARYRAMVSQAAYELAVFLSVPDPLTVPVMRLVQRSMLPSTGTGELAEFFVGGLIRRMDNGADDKEACYRFIEGVREELVKSLRYSEEGEINAQLRSVGRFLLEEGSADRSFEAFFPSPSGQHRITAWSLPFASVSKEVLTGRVRQDEPEAPAAEPPIETPDADAMPDVLLQIEFMVREGRLVFTLHDGGVTRHWSSVVSMELLASVARRLTGEPERLQFHADRIVPLEVCDALGKVPGTVGVLADDGTQGMPWELLLWTRQGRRRDLLALTRPMVRQHPSMALERESRPPPVVWVVGDPAGAQAPLPLAQQEAMEVGALLNHLPAGYQVRLDIRDSSGALRSGLRSQPYRVLFISGHGVATGSDRGQVLGIQHGQNELFGVDDILVHEQPPELVFLACNYLAGLAPQLLARGVRAVVAAQDVVDEHSAFPMHFFERIVKGLSFGQAVFEARRECFDKRRDDNDLKWSQYAAFGDQDYQLVRDGEAQVASAATSVPPSAVSRAKQWHVFVSYSRRDRPDVDRFREALAEELKGVPELGITADDIWIDEQGIQAGEVWNDAVTRAMEESAVLVFMVSEGALQSVYVREEVARAVSLGIPVQPVILQDCNWRGFDIGAEGSPRPLASVLALPRGARSMSDSPRPLDAWREVAEDVVKALPQWVQRAAVRQELRLDQSLAGPMDPRTFSLIQHCSRIPNHKVPSGYQNAVWVGSDIALTCAFRSPGRPLHWEEPDRGGLSEEVVDVFARARDLEAGGIVLHDKTVLVAADREAAADRWPKLLVLVDKVNASGRPRPAAQVPWDNWKDHSLADIVYYQDQTAVVRCAVLASRGPEEGCLRLQATEETEVWPLPPEAHGAPVFLAEDCIGVVIGHDGDGDFALAKDTGTVLAARRLSWLLRLLDGSLAHASGSSAPGPVKLPGADLSGASFSGLQLSGAHLMGATFDRATLRRCLLSRADLSGVTYRDTTITDCSFAGANLQGAGFTKVELQRCDFSDADLSGANFESARLVDCTWEGARLNGTGFNRSQADDPAIKRAVEHSRLAEAAARRDASRQKMTVMGVDRMGTEDARRLLDTCAFKFLAAGDSWFSNSPEVSLDEASLLHSMGFAVPAVAFSCVPPANTLGSSDRLGDLMNGLRAALRIIPHADWSGILLSFGGDAMLEAVSVPYTTTDGGMVPQQSRLLLNPSEWDTTLSAPDRCVSLEGMKTLQDYLQAQMTELIRARDESPLRGRPILMHAYATPIPRPSGTRDGRGPWLQPSFSMYGIPIEDHAATAQALYDRLRGILAGMANDASGFPNVGFFYASQVRLQRAGANQRLPDGDWATEVHPNAQGYAKLGAAFSDMIAGVLGEGREGSVAA